MPASLVLHHLQLVPLLFFRMTSQSRSSDGGPRPSRARGGRSTSGEKLQTCFIFPLQVNGCLKVYEVEMRGEVGAVEEQEEEARAEHRLRGS